jgi:hypothetical protein
MFFGTGQTVDCAVDLVGIPTDVTSGRQRAMAGRASCASRRQLSDPAHRRQRAAGVLPTRRVRTRSWSGRHPRRPPAPRRKPRSRPTSCSLCDVRRRPRADADPRRATSTPSRRQAFIFAQGDARSRSTPGTWSVLAPARQHTVAGHARRGRRRAAATTSPAAARRHPASAIDYRAARLRRRGDRAGGPRSSSSTTLAATTAGDLRRSTRVGADAVGRRAERARTAATVDRPARRAARLARTRTSSARSAARTTRAPSPRSPHAHISAASTCRGSSRRQVVADLKSTNPSLGTTQVGSGAIGGVAVHAGQRHRALAAHDAARQPQRRRRER